jgi:hypothetical protein
MKEGGGGEGEKVGGWLGVMEQLVVRELVGFAGWVLLMQGMVQGS